jgi:hypothetical protein
MRVALVGDGMAGGWLSTVAVLGNSGGSALASSGIRGGRRRGR